MSDTCTCGGTGIVPQFARKMLKLVEERSDASDDYEVHLSMLEVYNETVKDLLSPFKLGRKGLKVREHPKSGFYGRDGRMNATETPFSKR